MDVGMGIGVGVNVGVGGLGVAVRVGVSGLGVGVPVRMGVAVGGSSVGVGVEAPAVAEARARAVAVILAARAVRVAATIGAGVGFVGRIRAMATISRLMTTSPSLIHPGGILDGAIVSPIDVLLSFCPPRLLVLPHAEPRRLSVPRFGYGLKSVGCYIKISYCTPSLHHCGDQEGLESLAGLSVRRICPLPSAFIT